MHTTPNVFMLSPRLLFSFFDTATPPLAASYPAFAGRSRLTLKEAQAHTM